MTETLFELKNYTRKNNHAQYKSDFQTPKNICDYMISLLPYGIKEVLEPTPGEGNIVTCLKDKNFIVTAADDFFILKQKRFEAIVMNPPFSSKYALLDNAPAEMNKKGMALGYFILTECMNKSDIIIALMPWFTISDSDVRLRYIKRFGLKSVTILPRKTFEYARIQTVILELNKGYQGETIFKVYDLIK